MVFQFEDIFWKWYQLICVKKGIKGIINIVGVENDSFWEHMHSLVEQNKMQYF
ncbi:hypothetical protein D3C80_2192960 [compost metagenome]